MVRNFKTSVDSCTQHHARVTEDFHPHEHFWRSPPATPNLWQPLIFSATIVLPIEGVMEIKSFIIYLWGGILYIVVKNTSHNIYHLNHFQRYTTSVNYVHKDTQHSSRTFSSFKTDTLYPLNSSPFLPPRRLWKPPFYFLSTWLL